MKTAKLIVIFIGIIAAFVCGMLIAVRGEREPEIEEDCKKVDSRGVLPDDSSDSDFEKRTDFFEMAERKLASENLTFASVDSLYSELMVTFGGEDSSGEYGGLGSVPDKIKAYHQVVNILLNGMVEEIKALDVDNEYMRQLNECHRNLVLAIYYGDYRKSLPRLYAEKSLIRREMTFFGKESGLNFFINQRDYGRYTGFNDFSYFFSSRNYKPEER